MDRRKSVRVRARLSVRRIVVPKRRFEIKARADAHNRNGPQGWTPFGPLLPQQVVMVERPALLSLTRHIGFLQLDDGVMQRFHAM
jgi:hypothetical protein